MTSLLKHRCEFITQKGTQCVRNALEGEKYCKQHLEVAEKKEENKIVKFSPKEKSTYKHVLLRVYSPEEENIITIYKDIDDFYKHQQEEIDTDYKELTIEYENKTATEIYNEDNRILLILGIDYNRPIYINFNENQYLDLFSPDLEWLITNDKKLLSKEQLKNNKLKFYTYNKDSESGGKFEE
jgi:hypothetical protein